MYGSSPAVMISADIAASLWSVNPDFATGELMEKIAEGATKPPKDNVTTYGAGIGSYEVVIPYLEELIDRYLGNRVYLPLVMK